MYRPMQLIMQLFQPQHSLHEQMVNSTQLKRVRLVIKVSSFSYFNPDKSKNHMLSTFFQHNHDVSLIHQIYRKLVHIQYMIYYTSVLSSVVKMNS